MQYNVFGNKHMLSSFISDSDDMMIWYEVMCRPFPASPQMFPDSIHFVKLFGHFKFVLATIIVTGCADGVFWLYKTVCSGSLCHYLFTANVHSSSQSRDCDQTSFDWMGNIMEQITMSTTITVAHVLVITIVDHFPHI